MTDLLGTVVTGLVTDENDRFYYVQKSGQTFQLAKDLVETPMELGSTVSGFVYENTNKQKVMTTVIPKIQQNHYDWGTVTEVRRDLGVFVDIGLPDKDTVVSLDDLPQENHLWPKKGDRLYISLKVDKKDRVWGNLADEFHIQSLARLATDKNKDRVNTNVQGTVYRTKLVGSYVLTEDYYQAFIHPTEWQVEPRLGELVSGRIIGIGKGGAFNISLKPRAHEAISDDAAMILAILERESSHFLPFHDKSDPEDIKQYFGISKAQFKRAIGSLYKAKAITITNLGIELTSTDNERGE